MIDDKDMKQALAQTAWWISKIQAQKHYDNTNEESNSLILSIFMCSRLCNSASYSLRCCAKTSLLTIQSALEPAAALRTVRSMLPHHQLS